MIDTLTNPIAPFDCPLGHKKTMFYVTSGIGGKILKFQVLSINAAPRILANCAECGLLLDFLHHDIALK